SAATARGDDGVDRAGDGVPQARAGLAGAGAPALDRRHDAVLRVRRDLHEMTTSTRGAPGISMICRSVIVILSLRRTSQHPLTACEILRRLRMTKVGDVLRVVSGADAQPGALTWSR